MNILIVGCGKVGSQLALTLTEDGHDVSVIANDTADIENNLTSSFHGNVLCGVAIDRDNLEKAGIESCDVCCAVTSDDNTNLMVAQLAKEIYGVKKVISRIIDPERAHIFNHFGLETISPTSLTVEAIAAAIKPVAADKYLSLGSHTVRFTAMPIPDEFIGIKPCEIEYEENETLFAVVNADGKMTLVDNYHIVLHEGDTLIFSKRI